MKKTYFKVTKHMIPNPSPVKITTSSVVRLQKAIACEVEKNQRFMGRSYENKYCGNSDKMAPQKILKPY